MSFRDEYKQFCEFVLENDVAHKERPVLFDREDEIYVVHESQWPDRQYEQTNNPSIMVGMEVFYFCKKVAGFRPKVVGE